MMLTFGKALQENPPDWFLGFRSKGHKFRSGEAAPTKSGDFSKGFSRVAEGYFHPALWSGRRGGRGRTAAAAGVARISLPSNPLLRQGHLIQKQQQHQKQPWHLVSWVHIREHGSCQITSCRAPKLPQFIGRSAKSHLPEFIPLICAYRKNCIQLITVKQLFILGSCWFLT